MWQIRDEASKFPIIIRNVVEKPKITKELTTTAVYDKKKPYTSKKKHTGNCRTKKNELIPPVRHAVSFTSCVIPLFGLP